ncbi:hypothetical protein [Actinoplanes siamensis]|uniref:Uncharacterized protein n=1 Tax=Actinoplanes siamensis TaxID=1223317 RepID=A0A919N8I0_9ACTN|nr:hypothetical protein Asi03nite_37950 [Actinoplanes siamensis]
MAMPRKGSRLITVDGTSYRWAIRPRPTYDEGLAQAPMTFVVELADAPGQVLVVATTSLRPDNWFSLPGGSVTPRIVETSVQAALAAGWEPGRSGDAFRLAVHD